MGDAKTKSDEHGEYKTDAGEPHPIDPDDVSYDPCNAVLKFTFERYGERRYCSGMAVSNFTRHDVETDYEHPQFCKHHQARAHLMKQHEKNFKTGAYTKSHAHKFQYIEPHKKLIANDLFKSLLDESTYDYETDTKELEVDVEDNDFAPDADVIVMDHPVPTTKEVRGKALWHAALDFVTMESIREEQFRVAAEKTGPDGEQLAIGERTTVVSVTDEGREITDRDEHHLNLALSRIQKDYEQHLKFGGVEYDQGGEDDGDMSSREWVAVIEPDDEPAPEAQSGEQSPMEDITPPEND